MTVNANRRSAMASNKVPVAPGRSPVTWWRSIAAPNFHVMVLGAMQAAVERVEMLDEPLWREAVAGDATAAAAMALLIDFRTVWPGKLDLVMTALVINACDGDAAACVVLSNVIRRVPGAGKREARIATSWLMRAFRPFADRHESLRG